MFRSTDVWNSLPQSVVGAPSVQSLEEKLDKLWKKPSYKNRLHCTTSTVNCHLQTQSHNLDTMLKTELAQEAAMPNTREKNL